MTPVCIITGGNGGIGQHLVEGYIQAGYHVVNFDVKPLPDLLKPYFNKPSNHLFMQGNLANPNDIEHLIQAVRTTYGQIDVMVHNAMASYGGLETCSYEQFMTTLAIGVGAPFWMTKLAMPFFAPSASIINIASTRAFMSQANTESYSAAKGGIVSLTHAMAATLNGKTRVNAIAPGWIHTITPDITNSPDLKQHWSHQVGHPKDIVQAALFLSNPHNSFINGQVLVVDGGMTKRMIYHNDEGWTYQP